MRNRLKPSANVLAEPLLIHDVDGCELDAQGAWFGGEKVVQLLDGRSVDIQWTLEELEQLPEQETRFNGQFGWLILPAQAIADLRAYASMVNGAGPGVNGVSGLGRQAEQRDRPSGLAD